MATPNFDKMSTEDMQALIDAVNERQKQEKAAKREEGKVLITEGVTRLKESFGFESDPTKPSLRERAAARLARKNDDEVDGTLPDPA